VYRAVLDTTELLENILSHLPPKQLFGVQRVCRLWKDFIARSSGIQEKLFLKLQGRPAELWALLERDVGAEFGPRKSRLEKVNKRPALGRGNADVRTFTPVDLNPFLQHGHDSVEGPVCKISACDRADYMTPEITEFCHGLTFGLNSSLLDTYICDPPCMRAHIALSYFSSPERLDCYRLEASFIVQTDKPLTLRDVLAETWTDDVWINKMKSVKIYDDCDFLQIQ
jgi:hypothetical protein